MSDASVADQLLFDALPPETRAAIERVIASQVETLSDAAWLDGFNTAKDEARADKRAKKSVVRVDLLTQTPKRPPS